MPNCVICGKPIKTRVACRDCRDINSTWKSYNTTRAKRGHAPITIEQYKAHRASLRERWFKERPNIFNPEDLTGPTVVWDGGDHSPCIQGCEHQRKDKHRYGCVKCEERSKFDAASRHEFYGIGFNFGGYLHKNLLDAHPYLSDNASI